MSELLPLTVFFTVIIFNIKFPSGIANGFIFYSQVVNALAVSLYSTIKKAFSLIHLEEIHHYSCFNMEFLCTTIFLFAYGKQR